MVNVIVRLGARSSVTILLIASFIIITAQSAAASEGPENKAKDGQPPAAATATQPAEPSARISNPAYAEVSTASASAEPSAAAAARTPEAAFTRAVSSNSTAMRAVAALPRASTAPMSAGEKFNLFVKGSFVLPGAIAQPIASGLFNELLDNNEGKEDTLDDFFADAMTRAARSYAFRVTSNFFEDFAYPVILRQDPRYHRSNKDSAGGKIAYAISRVFVTQGDRSGDQPNVSFLAGGLTAAAISNVWVRDEHRNVSNTFRRWGIHIGLSALSNILREFLGGQ
jgi:hypothetical protein